jgi:hypothetical protein
MGIRLVKFHSTRRIGRGRGKRNDKDKAKGRGNDRKKYKGNGRQTRKARRI